MYCKKFLEGHKGNACTMCVVPVMFTHLRALFKKEKLSDNVNKTKIY